MEKENILTKLKEKGYTPAMIAEALKVTPQSVYSVISSGNGSERIAKAIAAALGQPLKTIFPFYEKKEKAKIKREINKQQLTEQLQRIA